MEKSTPHYKLTQIQTLVMHKGIETFTHTARLGFLKMGLTEEQALQVISTLDKNMFYKSMTTYSDHRIWQDVYHAPTPVNKIAYIKFTLRDNTVVIQFKEK